MGNDGGSIPDRRDLVRTKAKAEQADKNNQTIARWFFCALSKRPLEEPIASCALGKLYNKDAIIEFLLNKSAYGDGEEICGHIKSLKDIVTLKLTPNNSTSNSSNDTDSGRKPLFICPLNLKEMTGTTPFLYLSTCGCTLSSSGFRALASPTSEGSEQKEGTEQSLCPQCGKKYDKATDIRTINPTPEEEEKMREVMEVKKAAVKSSKKRKAASSAPGDSATSADSKNGDLTPNSNSKRAKVQHAPSPTPAPSMGGDQAVAAVARKVASALAEEEKKRKGTMSAAVASLYQSKNPNAKQTFTTMGTFNRYAA
jgi:hypothetical protein